MVCVAGREAECSIGGDLVKKVVELNGLVSSLREGILSHDGTPMVHAPALVVVPSLVGEVVSSEVNEAEVDGG